MKSRILNMFIVGFAVFAMFFGAGNLIFPPYIGMLGGENWLLGFAGFVLMDVICSIAVLIIMAKRGKGVDGIFGILGNRLSKLMLLAVVICIGPLVAIPRTAATTFELSMQPLFPGINSIVFSIVFFTIVYLLCVRPSKIVDIVGSILSPLLLIALSILIVKGIASPLGAVAGGASAYKVVNMGVTAGYQAMDVMSGVVLSVVVLGTITAYGYQSKKEEMSVLGGACVIAGIALVLVYGGLAYFGATASNVYDNSISRSQLMIQLAGDILGSSGTVVLGIIVAAACLTTAIGITSACASYMRDIFNHAISYEKMTLIICVFSAVVCNFGLNTIISLASPILDMLYPILIMLIILAAFPENSISRGAQLGGVGATALFVIVEFLEQYAGLGNITAQLPLATFGFAWVLPALAGMVAGEIARRYAPLRNMILRVLRVAHI